jgi:hypothetical protein
MPGSPKIKMIIILNGKGTTIRIVKKIEGSQRNSRKT